MCPRSCFGTFYFDDRCFFLQFGNQIFFHSAEMGRKREGNVFNFDLKKRVPFEAHEKPGFSSLKDSVQLYLQPIKKLLTIKLENFSKKMTFFVKEKKKTFVLKSTLRNDLSRDL
jgi:hypothetical protein